MAIYRLDPRFIVGLYIRYSIVITTVVAVKRREIPLGIRLFHSSNSARKAYIKVNWRFPQRRIDSLAVKQPATTFEVQLGLPVRINELSVVTLCQKRLICNEIRLRKIGKVDGK